MTDRYNPQHGANMVDRYIGSAFDVVYAVYKQLPSLPVIYDFAVETVPLIEESLDQNRYIISKIEVFDQAVLDTTEAASSAENSANTATIRLNSIEQLYSEIVINRDESFQYRNESFQYKNDAEYSAAAAKESQISVAINANQIASDAASSVIAGVNGKVAVAQSEADRAEAAAERAKTSLEGVGQALDLGAANIYLDVASGLAASEDTDIFWVVPNGGDGIENLTLYINNASEAVEMYVQYSLNQFMYVEDQKYV